MTTDPTISTPHSALRTPHSPLRSWLELFRLPNVFTAMADVLMGYLVTHDSLAPRAVSLGLVGASALLYTAGMVLNDVFDAEVDARERPERPIPSGRIARSTARWVGVEMLLVGAGLGWLAGSFAGSWRTGVVASLLAVLVVLYDAWLKRTPLGPLGMGGCRMLNVLLGMSAANGPWLAPHWLVAGGIGTYIVGVTWFAKSEAEVSNRWRLATGVVIMTAGLALLAWFPDWTAKDGPALQAQFDPGRWRILWLVLGLLIGGRAVAAVVQPTPQRVQAAVKNAILSLITLDAVLVFAVHGWQWSLVIFVLVLPAMFLGRWIYST